MLEKFCLPHFTKVAFSPENNIMNIKNGVAKNCSLPRVRSHNAKTAFFDDFQVCQNIVKLHFILKEIQPDTQIFSPKTILEAFIQDQMISLKITFSLKIIIYTHKMS